jgi:UDP-glucose:(heptosyl)LPS alpha-1,3-glucosyltransferase
LVAAGFPVQRLRLVPNGIDLSRAIARVRTVEEARRDCGLPHDTPLVLLFGWDPERKGVDTGLEAVGALVAAGKPVILGLVGTDALSDYVRQRRGNVLPSWVRLMPPTENVADYYQAAAIFISASRKEGLPYAVCEAMANDLPVILSDIPTQAFAHGSSGAVFFPPGDATALREALRRVLEWTAAERAKAVSQNQALIKQGYSVSNWADQVTAIYRELVGKSRLNTDK